jgi:hypothetical protein
VLLRDRPGRPPEALTDRGSRGIIHATIADAPIGD